MLGELGFVLIAGIKFGALYALAALGLVVVHKATKTVNFAHGAFAMLGAFASFLIVVKWQWPYWAAYLLIPPAIGLVAAAIEFLILRRLRQADMFTVVIATVFLGIALSEGFRLTYNTELLGGAADVYRTAVHRRRRIRHQGYAVGYRAAPWRRLSTCIARVSLWPARPRHARHGGKYPRRAACAAIRSTASTCSPGFSAARWPGSPACSSRRSPAFRSIFRSPSSLPDLSPA